MTPKATNRTEFVEECKSGALDGVVAVYRTFPSISITGRVDEELVPALPKSLKYICHNGTFPVPLDLVPCDAATTSDMKNPQSAQHTTSLIEALRPASVCFLVWH